MQNTPDNESGNDLDLSASGRPIGGIYATKKRKNRLLLPLLLLILILAGGVAYMMFGQDLLDAPPARLPAAQEAPAPGDIVDPAIDAPPQPEVIENAPMPGAVPADDAASDQMQGQMPGMIPADSATPAPADGMGTLQDSVPEILPPPDNQPATPDAATTTSPVDAGTAPADPAAMPVENPDMTAPLPVPDEPETPDATQPESSSAVMPLVGPSEDFAAIPNENTVNPVTATLETSPAMPPPMEFDAAPQTAAAAPDVSGTTAGEVAILQSLGAVDSSNAAASSAPAVADDGSGTQLGAAPPAPRPAVVDAQIRDLPVKYFVIEKAANVSDPGARIAAGKRALEGGRASSAVTMFDELYNEDPTDTRVLAARAVALQKAGRAQEAIAAYEELLKVEPANLNALTSLLGLLRTQNSDLALEQLLRLRQAYPSHAGIAAQLGVVYGDRGQLDEAVRFLGVANSLEPMNAVFKFNMAVVMDKLGNSVEAESLYRQALELDSRYNTARSAIPRQAIENRISSLQ